MDNLNTFNLHEDCFFIIFDDFFNLYVQARENTVDKEMNEKIKEDMIATIDLIKEDTSKLLINGFRC
jgi:hypothetical protein